MLRRLLWYPGYLLRALWEGDRIWAVLRFIFLGVVTMLILIVLGAIEMQVMGNFPQGPGARLEFFEIIEIAAILFIRAFRFLTIALLAFVLAFMFGARYVQDIYELRRYRTALRYLAAGLFGFFYPVLEIDEGGKVLTLNEENTLDKIGGPGFVMIRPGNAVLFENLKRPSNVRAAGVFFVPRFEFIKEIVDLNDQEGRIERLRPTLTRDGIRIGAKDVRFLYRLFGTRREGLGTGRIPQNPYPFAVQAVESMVYNRTMTTDEITPNDITPWNTAVSFAIDGAISDFINNNRADDVLKPPAGQDPREQIRRTLLSRNSRNRLRNFGAELLWFDIGHFFVEDEEVGDQLIKSWAAPWIRDQREFHALGEAQRQAFAELGRAEAHTMIVIRIINAFRSLPIPEGQKAEALREFFLLQASQVIETLSKAYESRYQDEDRPKRLEEKND